MKKATVNKTSRHVVKKVTHFDLSEIAMAPPKGTAARVILLPAAAPRHVKASVIAAAVLKVVTARRIDASFNRHVAIARPSAKPIVRKPSAKKTTKLRGHSRITTDK